MRHPPTSINMAASPKKQAEDADDSSTVAGGIAEAVNLPTSELRRDLNVRTLIGFGFSLSSSWLALSLSSIIAIAQGGTVTLLYGTLVVALPYVCTGLTLAELISVYPTAGGQYHFTSILAPPGWANGLSYISGTSALFSWFAVYAGTLLIIANILFAMVIQYDLSFVPQPWHYFLIYQVINVLTTIYNVYLVKKSLKIYDISWFLSAAGCLIIPIVCLTRAEQKQSNEAVWTAFTNNTGWNDGICFLTGLITPSFAFGGLDATMHLVEETIHPKKAVSKALCYAIGLGITTAFLFTVAMAYCIDDIDAILSTPTGMPIYQLWINAMGSVDAATVFMVLILIISLVVSIATAQTASRLTWALGRDNAFYGSSYLAKVHKQLGVPVRALVANTVIVGVFGFLYLASTTAFNSFLGVAAQLLQFSFAFPAALLIWRRRSTAFLPHNRFFRLPHPVGYACHFIAVAWSVVIMIFYMFPVALPVTSSSMNYAAVVVAIGSVILGLNWIFHARKHFDGPVIEMQE
ncbi:hypothetical protein MAPG_05871 [Magnaporthiopsis poae ATCC 64411]|uniref:Choline transporter n=1 Tax=Magnaporthiopsis poae (strain ATCC 64411 / 73-15) TaxID=644358 RepID=A0A0C4E0J4_MAGP6|nr:hypothetical protein MAPG_05871 [Magnaporthiopsis poae ATCC 64411]